MEDKKIFCLELKRYSNYSIKNLDKNVIFNKIELKKNILINYMGRIINNITLTCER